MEASASYTSLLLAIDQLSNVFTDHAAVNRYEIINDSRLPEQTIESVQFSCGKVTKWKIWDSPGAIGTGGKYVCLQSSQFTSY